MPDIEKIALLIKVGSDVAALLIPFLISHGEGEAAKEVIDILAQADVNWKTIGDRAKDPNY